MLRVQENCFEFRTWTLQTCRWMIMGRSIIHRIFSVKRLTLRFLDNSKPELAALALGQVYTFGPTFRAENSNTSRHLAEFWMIEPEVAFSDLNDNMDLTEDFLKYITRYVLDNCADDL